MKYANVIQTGVLVCFLPCVPSHSISLAGEFISYALVKTRPIDFSRQKIEHFCDIECIVVLHRVLCAFWIPKRRAVVSEVHSLDRYGHCRCRRRRHHHLAAYQTAAAKGARSVFPQQKGEGPAQDVWKRICAYRSQRPDATWRELYDNIPNHYASHKNMYSAMRFLRERMARREARKAEGRSGNGGQR